MPDGRAGVGVLDGLLHRLASAGYVVTAVAGDPEQVSLPRGFRAQLRLGEVAGPTDAARRLVMLGDIDLRGDVATPGLRRWRIERPFAEFDGAVGWVLRMHLTVTGDLSSDYLVTEGQNAVGLLFSLVRDGRLTLARARVLAASRSPAPPGPDLIIDLLGASDLATGSYHLAWYGDRRRTQTPEHRRIRLAACDRLSEEVLPALSAACHQAMAAARRASARAQPSPSRRAAGAIMTETEATPTV